MGRESQALHELSYSSGNHELRWEDEELTEDRYLLTLVIKARKCMCLYRNSYKALSKMEASFRRPIFGILGVKAKLWLLAQRPPRLQGEDQAGLESGFCVSSQPRFLHTLTIAHFSVIMGCWMWLCRQQGLCMGSCSGHS